MTSPSLRAKIRSIERAAPLEVPKARLCAAVILDLAHGSQCDGSVAALKSHLGNNWSPTLAIQFMSGRRGEMAALAAPHHERAELLLAHMIAREACCASSMKVAGAIDSNSLVALTEIARNQAKKTSESE